MGTINRRDSFLISNYVCIYHSLPTWKSSRLFSICIKVNRRRRLVAPIMGFEGIVWVDQLNRTPLARMWQFEIPESTPLSGKDSLIAAQTACMRMMMMTLGWVWDVHLRTQSI